MSYEEDYREPYIAECACGKGYVRYFKIVMSNDWGQERESSTSPEILCDECKQKYHCESDYLGKYLIPEGLTLDLKEPKLKQAYKYTDNECFVQKHSKDVIEEIISDMTAPKHRYIKDLITEDAQKFAQEWASWTRKKSLKPMIKYLQEILTNYDNLVLSIDEKRPHVEKYELKYGEYTKKLRNVREKSFKLQYKYDYEYENQIKKEREQYLEEHKYDDFQANVHYDESFKKDFSGQYWDTLFIEKTVEDPYLILEKDQYLHPQITIAKKYRAHCSICGRTRNILSSNLRIEYDEECGYILRESCNCHKISSFEAKTMSILNHLGVTYEREVMFDGLTGDAGYPLRFDFAMYREKDSNGVPIYNLAIELQGPHHYDSGYYNEYGEFIIDSGTYSSERYEKQQRNDSNKANYCMNNGIKLECIKYTTNDYERLEKRLIKILKENGYNFYTDEY